MMKEDPDAQVRKVVASRITGEGLFSLAHDKDIAVRLTAIDRLPPNRLAVFLSDLDWQVRYHVALRIPSGALMPLLEDPEPVVREVAVNRLAEATVSEGQTLN
jgi:hypothetical protein